MYRRRRITVTIAALLTLFGGYSGVVACTPLPTLHPKLLVEAETTVHTDEAAALAAVQAQELPTAVGWLHDEEVWANDNAPHRMASLTKVITALVGLEAAPIEAGTTGPSYTITETDAEILADIIAEGGSFAPAPLGLEVTARQMLELILVPSANNYAISYARWVFGSDEAFLAAAHEWLTRHGLESVRIYDASGMNDNNQATTADMVRLSRLALAHPIVAEIVGSSVIEIPGLGEITTTNRLLGDPGVLGIKTGTTFPAGYSLAAAQLDTASGRELIAIAVVMDRENADQRAHDARATLAALAAAWQQHELSAAGEVIGTVTDWRGETVQLVSAASAATILVPGETGSRHIALPEGITASPAGSTVASLELLTPLGEERVPVVTAGDIIAPGFWWKFTHPGELFDWR